MKSYVGLYKSYVGDKKSYVGDKKSYVGLIFLHICCGPRKLPYIADETTNCCDKISDLTPIHVSGSITGIDVHKWLQLTWLPLRPLYAY